MSIELTITIRDEEKRRLSKSFLCYEAIAMSEEDPYISECLKELLAEFKGEPDDIKIKAEMILR